MKTRISVLLLALPVLALVLASPANSQTGIILTRADTVRQEGVSLNTGLSSVTSSVGPRIVLQYANTKREEQVSAPPSALQTLFAQVPARIILQYTNTMRQERVTAPPAGLQTLFGQVASRIILQYANTSRQVTLAYPKALIGDTVPPMIRDVRAQSVGGGVKITWTTDEFATSEVRYGTAPDAYTQTTSDPLFDKTHSLTLTGLTAGQTYYFIVRAADRSGNQAQSGEYQVKVQTKTYLPLIRRR